MDTRRIVMENLMVIAIPIMGGLVESKPFWGTLLHSVRGHPVDLCIVDNTGFDEGQMPFFERFIEPYWPGDVLYIQNENNVGVIKSMQQVYERTDNPCIAYLHNDVYVYKNGWTHSVIGMFDPQYRAGLVGFFGAEGADKNTGRFNVWNNMLEAERHGARFTVGVKEVGVLDGLSMFASREMLDVRGGVDTSFDIHHFYDLDLSLESIDRGFKNYVIPIPIHHQSGMTACKPTFQDWAKEHIHGGEPTLYEKNKRRYIDKWGPYLPWQVGQEWKKRGR
jgi:GT2 family glycosyltransferase